MVCYTVARTIRAIQLKHLPLSTWWLNRTIDGDVYSTIFRVCHYMSNVTVAPRCGICNMHFNILCDRTNTNTLHIRRHISVWQSTMKNHYRVAAYSCLFSIVITAIINFTVFITPTRLCMKHFQHHM